MCSLTMMSPAVMKNGLPFISTIAYIGDIEDRKAASDSRVFSDAV